MGQGGITMAGRCGPNKWVDRCMRTLIKFLVYCLKGIVFIKSIDISSASKIGDKLFKLFKEVVLYVGQKMLYKSL